MVSETRRYNIDFGMAFGLALKTAKKCFNVKKHSTSEGVIECTSGASLWSWGESIRISIRRINELKTEIEVYSTAKSQLIDWGKSRENVNLFFNIFETLI